MPDFLTVLLDATLQATQRSGALAHRLYEELVAVWD